jgi:hypothetical protein
MGPAYAFEWDPAKARSNLLKHGVAFDEACSAFGDPLGVLVHDTEHSAVEPRYLFLAMSNRSRLLVIAFAGRPPRTRLISARQANRQERRTYEEG